MRVRFSAINKISEYRNEIIRKIADVWSILFFIFLSIEFGETSSWIAYLVFGIAAMIIFAFDLLSQRTGADDKTENARPGLGKKALIAMCTMFGVIIILANYKMYEGFRIIGKIVVIMITLYSSAFVFYTILSFLDRVLPNSVVNKKSLLLPQSTFLIIFLLVSVVYLFFFLFSEFPGSVCTDSMDQLQQILDGCYSNHHPVYHTFLIQIFFNLGMKVFNDINVALATYTIFQILFMAAVFALTVTTFIDMSASKLFSFFGLIWFMAAPYHITFSFTIWKDSIFGGIVCLFTISLLRCINGIGNSRLNHMLLFGSAVCFCIFRSNGLFAFVLFLIIFWAVAGKKEKYYIKVFLIAIAASLILKYPVLQALSIQQHDTVEALSIPLQQIARVASEGGTFSEKETIFIENIIALERMGEVYDPSVSDNVKELIRYEGNQDYISEHKSGFIKAWMSVVMHHPVLTVRAWVDQTSGYWNPCPDYWMKWWYGVCEMYGLRQIVLSEDISNFFHQYVCTFTDSYFIPGLIYNVGFHVWIVLICLILCVHRKNKNIVYLLPSLTLTITLLLATPMHDEFRYAYYVYTCLPIIIYSTIIGDTIEC